MPLFKHKKETIKIQLNKMHKGKDFMDVEAFEKEKKFAMQTHMKKLEVVEIMRVLANKYSDLHNFDQAFTLIERAETLSKSILSTQEHYLMLDLKLCKIETVLK